MVRKFQMFFAPNILSNILSTFPYDKWKLRIIFSIVLSYATYYVTRLNFSFAIPSLVYEFGFTKTQIGLVLSAFSIVYGLGKFFSGIASDITSAKKIIMTGLLGTALINLIVPSITTIWFLAIIWGINGCFQAMGWPPCVRLINNWFHKNEIGTVWGLCNSAHAIGSSFIGIIAGILLSTFNWKALFYLPAAIAFIVLLNLTNHLDEYPNHKNRIQGKNNNKNLHANNAKSLSYGNIIFEKLLKSSIVWSMALGTMFLYVIRVGLLNWLPTFLIEHNHNMNSVGWQFSTLEFLGIFGGIAAGYISDKVGYIHRSKVAMTLIFGLIICIGAFIILPQDCLLLKNAAIMLFGFFIYGPQVLAGIIANDYASKSIAAAVTGFIGTFGYIGATFAGIGLGIIADKFGWSGLFITLFISSIACFLCFLTANHHSSKTKSTEEL